MQQTKIVAPPGGKGNEIAGKLPILDFATQTSIITSGNAAYLIRGRSDIGAAIEVMGRWIRSSKDKDQLRPNAEKGEFVHNHESGYHYLVVKVDAATAEAIIAECNAQR